MWCKTDGVKEDRGTDGDVGIEGNSGSDGKGNGVRWYGQVLRKALEFEVRGKRKRGRPKKTWKTQVEKQSKSVGLEKKDAMNRARWRVGVRKIADSRWRSRYYGLLHFLHLIALCHLETSRSLSEITGNQYGYIFNSFYQFCCDCNQTSSCILFSLETLRGKIEIVKL